MADSGVAPASAAAEAAFVTQQATKITASVDHLGLLRNYSESIRTSLKLYEQYSKEVTSRAEQLAGASNKTAEDPRPIIIKYCVDADWLESIVFVGFIENVDSVDTLTNEQLLKYLEKKAEESKETLTAPILDSIVERELRMDMKDLSSKSRMEALLAS